MIRHFATYETLKCFRFKTLYVAVLLLVSFSEFTLAQPSSGDERALERLLAQIRDARHRIQSGHFVASGTMPASDSDSRVEIWFRGADHRVDFVSGEEGSHQSRCLFKDGKLYFAETKTPQVAFRARPVRARVPLRDRFIDVRSVGLADAFELQTQTSIGSILDVFTKSGVPMRLGNATGGLVRLIRGPFAGGGTQIITFDPHRGFVPLESRLLQGAGNQQIIQSSWERIDEEWVPTRLKIRSRGILKVNLEFDWKAVNADISESILDPEFIFDDPKLKPVRR